MDCFPRFKENYSLYLFEMVLFYILRIFGNVTRKGDLFFFSDRCIFACQYV
jgi:hypothetical protein